jgi:hypothetical protein
VGVVHQAQKIVLENVLENIHHKVRIFLQVNLFQLMVGPGQGRGHQAYLGAARCWVRGDHQLQLKVGLVHPAQKIVLENVLENIHHKLRVFLQDNLFQFNIFQKHLIL